MLRKFAGSNYVTSEIAIKRSSGKLDHWLPSKTADRILVLTDNAVNSANHGEYEQSIEYIGEARILDPKNALWDYMLACLCFRKNDTAGMWRYIKSGNETGIICRHPSDNVTVDSWTYPEIKLMSHMSSVTSSKTNDCSGLWELVRMGNILANSEPACYDDLGAGLNMRKNAASRLVKMAKSIHWTDLAELCDKLSREKIDRKLLYSAWTQKQNRFMEIGAAIVNRHKSLDEIAYHSEHISQIRSEKLLTPVEDLVYNQMIAKVFPNQNGSQKHDSFPDGH